MKIKSMKYLKIFIKQIKKIIKNIIMKLIKKNILDNIKIDYIRKIILENIFNSKQNNLNTSNEEIDLLYKFKIKYINL